MRRAARVDANQTEIIAALRGAGCSVLPLHTIGKGCPDILVGAGDHNFLIELKASPKCKLTPDEQEFFESWRGQRAIATSVYEALEIIGINQGIKK